MRLKLIVPLVLALCPLLGLAQTKEARLGASFTRVWFKGGKLFTQDLGARKAAKEAVKRAQAKYDQTRDPDDKKKLEDSKKKVDILPTAETPLVGIEIDMDALKKAVIANVDSKTFSPAELASKIDVINTKGSDNKNYWCVEAKSLEGACMPIAYQHEEDTLVVIVNSKGSYNDSYTIKFNLGELLEPGGGKNMFLTQSNIRFTNRTTLGITTDFAPQDATLITQSLVDGKLVNDKDEAARVEFNIAYDGFPNPFQGLLFRERSFYKMKLSGTLSANDLDTKSKIEFSLSGVSDFLHLGRGLVTTTGFKVLTSQSHRETSFLYELGVRKGDRRSDSDAYVPYDKVLGTVYGEVALQGGLSLYKNIKNVPEPDSQYSPVLRPRFRIGAKDLFKSEGSKLTVSGFLDFYYLIDGLGGRNTLGRVSNGKGLREYFEVEVKLGLTENQTIKFSIEGGTNATQGFAKVTPTYNLGLDFKF